MLPSNRASVKPNPNNASDAADLLASVEPAVHALLAKAAGLAAAHGYRLWLVGGALRDLFLGLPLGRDIDLAIDGDLLAFAHPLASAIGGQVVASHTSFGTATVEVPALVLGQPTTRLLDLARTRAELYPQPAMLPLVRPASIDADLARRDFSINAIALELLVGDGVHVKAGQLLDPFGGRADLATGRLRLLHPASLRDDPTRMLRGLRLAARLGFAPTPETVAQLDAALASGFLGLLSAERILGELCLALEEPRPDVILQIADAWHVTPHMLPGLVWSAELAARFARRQAARLDDSAKSPSALVAAGLLLYELDDEQRAAFAARYPLPTPFARLVSELGPLHTAANQLGVSLRPSQIDKLLRPFSDASLAVLHYAEPAPAMVEEYLRKLRPRRIVLNGRDLQQLGVAPGPHLGLLLDELRAACLDGEVTTREQAEGWVRQRMDNHAD